MQITWTNCADEMPPETTRVILRPKEFPIATTGLSYFLVNNTEDRRFWEWTEFTKEKWEKLNDIHTRMETKP